jgi:hypothetical protein
MIPILPVSPVDKVECEVDDEPATEVPCLQAHAVPAERKRCRRPVLDAERDPTLAVIAGTACNFCRILTELDGETTRNARLFRPLERRSGKCHEYGLE